MKKKQKARAPGFSEPANSRAEAGHTQREAAALVGVAWRTWQGWELGTAMINPHTLRLYRHLAGIERIPFKLRTLGEILK